MTSRYFSHSEIVRASSLVQWECLLSDVEQDRILFDSFCEFMDLIWDECFFEFAEQDRVLADDVFWDNSEYFARMYEVRSASILRGESKDVWKESASWDQFAKNAKGYIQKQKQLEVA